MMSYIAILIIYFISAAIYLKVSRGISTSFPARIFITVCVLLTIGLAIAIGLAFGLGLNRTCFVIMFGKPWTCLDVGLVMTLIAVAVVGPCGLSIYYYMTYLFKKYEILRFFW